MKSWVVNCKKEAYDVYIGRPSEWGNPWSHQDGTLASYKVATREEAIAAYGRWVRSQPNFIAKIRKELKGKVLGCFCSPKPCHGDILASIANALIFNTGK